jgi:hypothetical protein
MRLPTYHQVNAAGFVVDKTAGRRLTARRNKRHMTLEVVIGEELGWRDYALPRRTRGPASRHRYSAFWFPSNPFSVPGDP